MKSKVIMGIMLTLLFIGMLTLAFNIQPVKAAGGIIYIRSDGSVDPPTAPIQRDGNVYTFTDNIYDSIVVERNNIVVDGAGYTLQGTGSGTGIDLTGRSNVTIKTMEIKAFTCGIILVGSSNDSITGNNIRNNVHGIRLVNSSNNTISGNSITNNSANGIIFDQSTNYNSISGNNIANNRCGVCLHDSSNNILRGNSITNNKRNFWVWGSSLSDFVNDVDASNTVDGKPIYYWINRRDVAVPLDAGYVALINCTRITVKNLNPTKNSQGVLLAYTINSTITKNNVTNNEDGILLYYSSNNTISRNNMTNNKNGIYLLFSSNNRILNNNAINNSWIGIELWSSGNNIISHNNVTDNLAYGIGLFDSSNNNTISNNTIVQGGWGLFLSVSSNNRVIDNIFVGSGIIIDGDSLHHFNTHIVENNIVNGKPICYYKDASNLTVTEDAGEVILVNCKNITVKNINAFYSSVGIQLAYTNHSIITNNNIMGNCYSGIHLYSSGNNTLSGNNLTNNWNGIDLVGSSNNEIYHNNFIHNGYQVSIQGSFNNTWDDGYPSGGNYWTDYKGTDFYSGPNQDEPGNDGIGDTAYVIDASNRDRYPLMYPWVSPPHSYTLTIYSSPTGVTFTVDGVSRTTPWSATYIEGTSVSLVMPETHDGYAFSHWLEDEDTNRTKTVTMDTNLTLTAVYTPPMPVGGIYIPVNKLELLAPYIELTVLLAVAVTTVVYLKKRKRDRKIIS